MVSPSVRRRAALASVHESGHPAAAVCRALGVPRSTFYRLPRRAANGIKANTIDPGPPWQNGFIESSNACARCELLNREQLNKLSEARVVISGWIDDYNAYRPHGALGHLSPDETMGAETALWPVGLTQEPSNTLPEATQLEHYGWPHEPSPIKPPVIK